jgi:hypothetical protein
VVEMSQCPAGAVMSGAKHNGQWQLPRHSPTGPTVLGLAPTSTCVGDKLTSAETGGSLTKCDCSLSFRNMQHVCVVVTEPAEKAFLV